MRFAGYLLLAWIIVSSAHAQGRLNLGLEPGANHGQPLALWSKSVSAGGRLAFDSVVFRQGRGSLRLELPAQGDAPRRAYVATSVVPLDSVRGNLLTVSAWVRTRGWQGRAGISATTTTSTRAGLSTERSSALDSLPANLDWRRIELRLPVKATAFDLVISIQAQGSGQVWFDDIQLQVGGRVLPEGPVSATEALLLPPAEALAPNWDFERPLPRATRPDPAGATAALDSASPQRGRRYLHLVRVSSPGQPTPSAYLGTLRLERQEGGKMLRVMGYWRQPGARPGSPANGRPAFLNRLLIMRKSAAGVWAADTLGPAPPLPPPGPQWTAFAFEVPVQLKLHGNEPADWGALTLSVQLPGPGALDIDNVSFALDGKPYVPTGPPVAPPPTAAEVTWLRSALRPLRLAAPATEATDLAALATNLSSARLVGLGEVTHGSHEIFALHDKLIRHLISQKGFTGLALEASPAACAALNDYVHTGQGDPARMLAALDGWHTSEVLDLVRWLRSYQQAHPATPLLLAGLDIQQPEQAVASLSQLVEPTDDFAQPRLRQLMQLLAAYPHAATDDPDLVHHPDQPQDSLLAPLHRLLAELAAGFDTRARLGRPLSLQLVARQRYFLRLVAQGATWRRLSFGAAFNYRQACLAENAQYLSQQEGVGGSSARLVLWANNRSVAKFLSLEERPMGQWLRATLGAGYAALGLALGQGSFAAVGPTSQWAPAKLATPPTGTYEAWLRMGPPAFWLDMGRLELTDANAWLFQELLLREVGRSAVRNEFMLHNLRGEFDAAVFLRDSTPAHFLP